MPDLNWPHQKILFKSAFATLRLNLSKLRLLEKVKIKEKLNLKFNNSNFFVLAVAVKSWEYGLKQNRNYNKTWVYLS